MMGLRIHPSIHFQFTDSKHENGTVTLRYVKGDVCKPVLGKILVKTSCVFTDPNAPVTGSCYLIAPPRV